MARRSASSASAALASPPQARVADEAAALRDLQDRTVYRIYAIDENTLGLAPASGSTMTATLEVVLDRTLAAQRRPAVTVRGVARALPASDPNGLAVFYVVIAWVFGGYPGETLLGLVRETRPSLLLLHGAFGALGGRVVDEPTAEAEAAAAAL